MGQKNVRILIFTMLHLKKKKKNTLRYHYFTPMCQKTEKSTWGCHRFTHVYHKSISYDVCFLRYGE